MLIKISIAVLHPILRFSISDIANPGELQTWKTFCKCIFPWTFTCIFPQSLYNILIGVHQKTFLGYTHILRIRLYID